MMRDCDEDRMTALLAAAAQHADVDAASASAPDSSEAAFDAGAHKQPCASFAMTLRKRRVRFCAESVAAHDRRTRARARHDDDDDDDDDDDKEDVQAEAEAIAPKLTRSATFDPRIRGASVRQRFWRSADSGTSSTGDTTTHYVNAHIAAAAEAAEAAATVHVAGFFVPGAQQQHKHKQNDGGDLVGTLTLPPVHFAPVALAGLPHLNVATELLPPVLDLAPPTLGPRQRFFPGPEKASATQRDPACAALLAHAQRLINQQQSNLVQTNVALLRVANARAIIHAASQMTELPLHLVDKVIEAQRFIFTMQSNVQQLTAQQDVIRAQLLHTQRVIDMIAHNRAQARA